MDVQVTDAERKTEEPGFTSPASPFPGESLLAGCTRHLSSLRGWRALHNL